MVRLGRVRAGARPLDKRVPGLAPADRDPGQHRDEKDRQRRGEQDWSEFARGPQSTVAAALSQAMRPAPNAISASVQRFSDWDIWFRSRRRWRGATGVFAIHPSRRNQATNITRPIASATLG